MASLSANSYQAYSSLQRFFILYHYNTESHFVNKEMLASRGSFLLLSAALFILFTGAARTRIVAPDFLLLADRSGFLLLLIHPLKPVSYTHLTLPTT